MITTNKANDILKLFFGQSKSLTASGNCYLALSTTTPNADGSNFSEPYTDAEGNDTGYARVQININEAQQYTNKMSVPTDGAIVNNMEITFPEALVNYPADVTHFGVFDVKEGGTPLYTHALTTAVEPYTAQPVSIEAGEVLLFRQGALSLAFAQE